VQLGPVVGPSSTLDSFALGLLRYQGGHTMHFYADAIRGGLFNLHFKDKDQEKDFIAFNDMSNRVANRNGIVLAYVSWTMLILYSFLFYRSSVITVSLPILCFEFPYFAFQLILLSKPKFMKYYQLSCSFGDGTGALLPSDKELFRLPGARKSRDKGRRSSRYVRACRHQAQVHQRNRA
jgi:hypothetical protein